MRLGVSLNIQGPEVASGPSYTEAMRSAEQAGFNGLWFFDAVARGTFRVDPVSAMSAAAAVTERIELGTCILQVPLRHPAELAHRILGLHYMASGRVCLGVGSGSTEGDFKATGNDFKARFRDLEAALPIMRNLWRGETVGDANLTPLEAIKGGPPILIGSWAGSRWIPIAAKQYDGWISSAHFTDIATLKEGHKRFKGEGGGRTVASNIPVDLMAGSKTLTDSDNLDLRCGPEEAKIRLNLLAEIGFDDAIVTVTDVSEEHLAEVRALYA
jgi:alkanesulfonate monooxygenase SsuD/methylene tetrahydromethanopterin reductase-like flavin-dependent oxidoreductase (luciferase family)